MLPPLRVATLWTGQAPSDTSSRHAWKPMTRRGQGRRARSVSIACCALDAARQPIVTVIPSRVVDGITVTRLAIASGTRLDERVGMAALAIGQRNPQASACWAAWAAMTIAKSYTSGLTSPPELPGSGPRHTSPNYCLLRPPRLLQIEVGRLAAHLCHDQVKGGLGDGVDAGDVGW